MPGTLASARILSLPDDLYPTPDISNRTGWLHQIMNVMAMSFCEVGKDATMSTMNATAISEDQADIENMKRIVDRIATVLCFLGIGGNLLNLKTLSAKSLQTIPFMYIRALAIFDVCGLFGVLINANEYILFDQTFKLIYKANVEPVFINTFFIGGLYCAFLLTTERYRLITNPHYRVSKPHLVAKRRIVGALICAFLLHLPLSAQFVPLHEKNTVGNNVDLLCNTPVKEFYMVYKIVRELTRFACVISMTVLNVIIARKLQITKRRRREMILRSTSAATVAMTAGATPSARSSLALSIENGQKREWNQLMRSFTEKKLTILMLGICAIYLSGNIPQMAIMVLQDESKDKLFRFQVYRQVGNCLEVLNHCCNFYVFCMASSEYSRAFIGHCRCLRFFGWIPCLTRIADVNGGVVSVASVNTNIRGGSPLEMHDMSTSSGGRKISNRDVEASHCGLDACSGLRKDSEHWTPRRKNTATSTDTTSLLRLEEESVAVDESQKDEEEAKPLRGILVKPSGRLSSIRGYRPKRSLTIANPHNEEDDMATAEEPEGSTEQN